MKLEGQPPKKEKYYPGDMVDNRDYADRFITAAEGIKAFLEKLYGKDFEGLSQAREYAFKQRHPVIRPHNRTIKKFVELRNVMQHSDVLDGKVLATPRKDAVLAIEEIAAKVKNPPRIRTYMIKNPDAVTPTDSLAKAAELVIEKGYSQLPVYDQGKYQALFTTNALARWLSEAMRREKGHLIEENVTISEVVEFIEDHEQPQFVRPTKSAYEVCDLFTDEELLPAVLVTTDGKSSGELQGIVTRSDIPTILQKITTRFAA